MSILKPIDLRDNQSIHMAVAALIGGKIGRIEFSESVNLKISRDGDSAKIEITDGKIEITLRGLPDPDFVRAECFSDHAIVSLSITDVRVDY